jgi:hypothetical protein
MAFYVFAPTLLGFLGNRAAQSDAVQNGPFSMGPLDLLAQVILQWVPIVAIIGIVGWVLLTTVAKLALAGRA